MPGLPNFRKRAMGDVVPAMLEPGEFVINRNAVNALGVDNLEVLNESGDAHSAIDRLIASASLVSSLEKARPPHYQQGGEVHGYQNGGTIRGARVEEMNYDDPQFLRVLMSAPASEVGGEGGRRYYSAERQYGRSPSLARKSIQARALNKMVTTPQDSIPLAMVESYFNQPEEEVSEGNFLQRLLGGGKQDGGYINKYQNGGEIEYRALEDSPFMIGGFIGDEQVETAVPPKLSAAKDVLYRMKDRGTADGSGEFWWGDTIPHDVMFDYAEGNLGELQKELYKNLPREQLSGYSKQITDSVLAGKADGGYINKYQDGGQVLPRKQQEIRGSKPYHDQPPYEPPHAITVDADIDTFLQQLYMRDALQNINPFTGREKDFERDALELLENMKKSKIPRSENRIPLQAGGSVSEKMAEMQAQGLIGEGEELRYDEPQLQGDSLMGMSNDRRVMPMLPPDEYEMHEENGRRYRLKKEVPKLSPAYMASFGFETPLSKRQRAVLNRMAINPESIPPQLRGLNGRILVNRMANELR